MPLPSRLLAILLILSIGAGCSLGPKTLSSSRLQYNEAVKTTTEQQLLLNIVRLRYSDSPSSLAVSTIADQRELSGSLAATPFFTSAAAGELGTYRGTVLPQAGLAGANRPTLSYTPNDDADFARRLFTPISLDGLSYLVKTTWPISTVCRLWLENLNWVSNAETASGPTPVQPPEYSEFQIGIEALQRLQDRGMIDIVSVEREERLSDGVASSESSPMAAIEAVKAGYEYRSDGAGGWMIVGKKRHPVLRIGQVEDDDPDLQTFCQAFQLDPTRRSFDLTTEKLDPFMTDVPPTGTDVVDLETRSLLQVLFFASQAVEVPEEHLACGLAVRTIWPDGSPFDWNDVLRGLLRIQCAPGRHPPPCAHVAIQYQGCWFYIDERDLDSKATFSLLIELSRLELGTADRQAPLLTIPLGGR